jgi:formamidopyrimidine-DNA glycosylase
MPEAPDLEAYAAYLAPRLLGRRVVEAKAIIPPVVKAGRELLPSLRGRELRGIARQGKHLRLVLEGDMVVAIHPMLSGRFHLVPAQEPRRPRTVFALGLDDGMELRLWDQGLTSRIYVAQGEGGLAKALPPRADAGPDALSPELTSQRLWERLRGHRGHIKSLIVSEKLVSGIGNAYADEVLFAAGINPFRPAAEMGLGEAERLLQAMRQVVREGTQEVLAMMERHGLPDEEYRGHMKVHRRGGQPCPRCGANIVDVVKGGRVTSYCPSCQQ